MFGWFADLPWYVRYGISGVFILISTILFFSGTFWPWGWAVGIVLFFLQAQGAQAHGLGVAGRIGRGHFLLRQVFAVFPDLGQALLGAQRGVTLGFGVSHKQLFWKKRGGRKQPPRFH